MKTKISNKLGLPEAYVIAIQNDPYNPDSGGTKSDYTITGLLKPPRMSVLSQTVVEVEDASDKLYSLQGQVIHSILERAKPQLEAQGFIIEKRFYKKYAISINGIDRIFTVSAQVDVFDPVQARVSDYKYTSMAAAKKGLKDEHKWQINFQAMLIREQGFKVEQADATILMRDWSLEKSIVIPDYPKSPCMLHLVPLFESEGIDKFIIERIRLHEEAKTNLPLCTDEEKWKRDTYAVMKTPFDKRAIRVFDTKEEATQFIIDKCDLNLIVLTRPGNPIRCLRYCPARFVCEQAKNDNPIPVMDGDGLTKVE